MSPKIDLPTARPRQAAARLIRPAVAAAVLALVCLIGLLLPARAAALSNIGPDPNDLGGQPGDVFEYLVTSWKYPAASVPISTVLIYFNGGPTTPPTGMKYIYITDYNLCTQPLESPGNMQDRVSNSPNAVEGDLATSYYVQNMAGTASTPVWGTVDGSTNCDTKTIQLPFNASLLTYDPDANKWKAQFTAQIYGALLVVENRFSIKVCGDAACNDQSPLVGYSAADRADSFALAMSAPYDVYRDYLLPFAPNCSLTAPATKRIELYDLDYGNKGIQPEDLVTYVVDTDKATGTASNAALTITDSSGNPVPVIPKGNNAYTIEGTSSQFVYVDFTMQPGHTYQLAMQHVYAQNLLQFQLPYDSVYAVSSTCSLPGTSPSPPPPPPSPTSRPYFQATGGDVAAGVGIASDAASACPAAPHEANAGIVSWNNHDTDFSGAGGEYAAFALNYVQDFVSGQGTNPPPNALTFANTNYLGSVNVGSGLFGGMFGGTSANLPQCVDYWSARPAALNAPGGPNPGAWGSGIFNVNGNFTLGRAGTTQLLAMGQHITLYVNGDVAIAGNIEFPLGALYARRSDIPSFQLIVHGRIFINKDVSQLDGLYAAIPDPGGGVASTFASPKPGIISTCSSGFSSYDPSQWLTNNMYNDCAKPLTFNGSVAAQQVWLLRGFSSVGGSPAEVFNYTPETWLAPSAASGASSSAPPYQSIVGLPPVL